MALFPNLSSRLAKTVQSLLGQGRLTQENIEATLTQIRHALLEADVALPVVNEFIAHVSNKAIGQEVLTSIKPGEMLVKIVYDELVKILGDNLETLNFRTTPPAVIMVVGLQGSGKTTTVAKLAHWIKETHKKKVLLASADIYRPAAVEQLQILAKTIEVPFFDNGNDKDPISIAKNAVQHAKTQFADVIIVDTAGRLHIDEPMMQELVKINNAINPIETLLVVDSMTGQDAANIAKTFSEKLPLTGVILTKADGDARGGAALSMVKITGKPIKFMGIGEKIDALEPFHPDRVASRILDMGDILSLVEEVQQKADQKKAEKLAKKIEKGLDFDLEDFKDQLVQMRNMGGISSLLGKLPGMGQLTAAQQSLIDDKQFIKMEAMINSMTLRERRFPTLIKGSHRRRIAMGSGTDVQDVNRLLKQFEQMQKMMKRFKGGKLAQMMSQFAGK